jgi:uncharacterized membrane protein YcjF (UPF0283 family)
LTLNPEPVTASETVAGALETGLVNANLAAVVTVALRAKLMLNATFWPPVTVTGRTGWVTERGVRKAWARESWLEMEATLATVTAVLAVLVAVAVKLLLSPSGTLPKLTALLGVVG